MTLQRTATHCYSLRGHVRAPPMPQYWCNCNALQHTATHCNTLQLTARACECSSDAATYTSATLMLQHTATHCNRMQLTARECVSLMLQHRCVTPLPCITLQHTATRYNTLHHTTTHCNTLQHTGRECRSFPDAATQVRAVPLLCNTL